MTKAAEAGLRAGLQKAGAMPGAFKPIIAALMKNKSLSMARRVPDDLAMLQAVGPRGSQLVYHLLGNPSKSLSSVAGRVKNIARYGGVRHGSWSANNASAAGKDMINGMRSVVQKHIAEGGRTPLKALYEAYPRI